MPEKSKAGRGPYPPEVRERAVRMFFDHQGVYPSQWKAIESMGAKLTINHKTLRQWVRRADSDEGERPGLTTDERARIKELEKENFELRRANEIFEAASAFSAPRWLINDYEIIDRCEALQPFTSDLTVITYDTGQATRARAADVQVKKLSTELGSEPMATSPT